MNNSPKIHTEIDDYLLYRRQFFFGPRYVSKMKKWTKIPVNKKHFLTIHPDLEITQLSNNDTELFLLGFILDPHNPTYSNLDILNNLLHQSQNFNSLVKHTYALSGRWIIIYKNINDIRIINDACGSRQIFYSFYNSEVWCASQPHTIAEILNLGENDDPAFLDFINSKVFKKHENTLFGNTTFFKEVLHLLPNHYLSITEKKTRRYWPVKATRSKNIDSVIKNISVILTGLYEAANNRYDLIQPITAGRDTRMLLAASKNVRKSIYYFIQLFNGLNHFSLDIKLPKKLIPYLGLNFNVVKCKKYDKRFDKYLRKNVYMIQNEKKRILHFNFFKQFQGKVNVSGNYTGIFRPFKWQIFVPNTTPLIKRSRGIYFKNYKCVADHINSWEDNYIQNLAKFNFPITDIFYWENIAANWVPMFHTELDIAIEEWCPFNCREILVEILSIDPKIRIKERFQKQLAHYLWPEVLSQPLQAPGHTFKNKLKENIYSTLIRLRIFPTVRYVYRIFFKK